MFNDITFFLINSYGISYIDPYRHRENLEENNKTTQIEKPYTNSFLQSYRHS